MNSNQTLPDWDGRKCFLRAALSYLLGVLCAWQYKEEITPLLLGGRAFEARSFPVQAALLFGEIFLLGGFFFGVLWATEWLLKGRLSGIPWRPALAGISALVIRARSYVQRSVVAQALLVSAVALLLVFPDVILEGASLRLTDLTYGQMQNLPVRVFYPQPRDRTWQDSHSDIGGGIFQSDPMMEFMLQSVKEGNSPYWNPYSAAGALGPETLIDNKFSFFNLIYILLGGGTAAYNMGFLLLAFWAAFFVYLLVRRRLGLGALAGIAAVIFYLLNGYFIANLGSNISQNYLYVPVCLYSALALFERFTAWRITGVVLAFAAFFSCTFIPTTFSSLLGMFPILLGWILDQHRRLDRRFWELAGGFALCLIGSILLLAFLYFPVIQNMRATGTLDAYAERAYNPVTGLTLASLFTSTHFFESYYGADPALQANPLLQWNVIYVYHFGILALNFAACALAFHKGKWPLLTTFCVGVALLTLGRVYGIPLISPLISQLPIVRVFGSQYWWPAAVFPILVLIAVGVDNLEERRNGYLASFLVFVVLVLSLLALALVLNFSEPRLQYKQVWTVVSIVLAGIGALAAFWSGLISDRGRRLLTGVLVLLMFGEMIVEAKPYRYAANDFYRAPTADITYLQEHAGLFRTMTLGYVSNRAENGSAFKIQEATSINQGTPPRYMDYFHSAVDMDVSQRLFYGYYPSLRSIQDTPETNPFNWEKINLLGVKYIIVPAEYTNFRKSLAAQGLKPIFDGAGAAILENPAVLPRAFTVELSHIPDPANPILPPDTATLLQPAMTTLYRNAEVRLEGKVERPSLLVLTDNWNADWKAEINGMPAPILLVDSVFRGVELKPGAYEVRMHYRPRSLTAALITSSAVLLLLTLLNLSARRVNVRLKRYGIMIPLQAENP